MNSTNQPDPFGYPQRRARGCSPGLGMFLLIGVFAFWMLSKDRSGGPDLPPQDQPGGVSFPDVLPESRDDGLGQPSPRSSRQDSSDWSIDTNAGSSSNGVAFPSDVIPSDSTNDTNGVKNKDTKTTKGDWSIDTDVGNK